MKVTFLLLPILAFLAVSDADQNTDQMIQELKPITERIVRKNTLKYQESCDYTAEAVRTKEGKALLDLMGSITQQGFDVDKFKNNLVRITTNIADIPEYLCNSSENLECNTKGQCDCASVDESYGFKLSFKREGNGCLIVPGSLCATSDILEQSRKTNPLLASVPKQEFRCASQSKCVVKSNGNVCTVDAMQAEFKRYLEPDKHKITNVVEYLFRKTKEGICVCKGASAFGSIFLVFFSAIFMTVKSCLV